MRHFLRSSAPVLAALTILAPTLAFAGPCSDEIATVGRQLSHDSALGPATSGTLSDKTNVQANAGATAKPDQHGTSADKTIGGTAGTKEMDAASSRVATSDADVRQQQAGKPTALSQATDGGANASAKPDDRMSRAKVAWQKAVDLNARNDNSCQSALVEAKQYLKGS